MKKYQLISPMMSFQDASYPALAELASDSRFAMFCRVGLQRSKTPIRLITYQSNSERGPYEIAIPKGRGGKKDVSLER